MHIIIVDPFSTSPNYTNTIAHYLSELDHKVFLIGANKSVNDMSDKGNKIIRRHFISNLLDYPFKKNLYIVQNFLRLILYPIALFKIYFLIRKYRVEVLHFQWSHIPMLELILIFFVKKKCKVIFTYHNTTRFHGEKHLLKDILSFGSKTLIHTIDEVIVHTEYSKTTFSKIYPKILSKINIVARGKDYFLPFEKIDLDKKTTVNPNKTINILFFGQISHYKGVDIMINAAPLLKNNNYKMQIYGRSELDENKLFDMALKNGVSQKISWKIKFLSNSEIHKAYMSADILVFPYRHIDQSAVLMSALNYGKPIVASRIGGFKEILKHETNGLLFEKENSKDLAIQLDKLIISAKKRKVYGDANLALSKVWPSWNEIAKITENIYR